EQALGARGGGIVVCLPPDLDERHINLLLKGAKAALEEPPDGRFVLIQHGGGAASFARTLYLERGITTCVVDVPPNEPRAVQWAVAEILSAKGYVEAEYDQAGLRWEPRLRLLSVNAGAAASSGELLAPLDCSDVLL